jgi:thioredoxin-like negative regulator of GroEL
MNIMGRICAAGVGVMVVSGLVLTAQASSIVLKNGRTLTGKSIEWRESTQDYLVDNEGASVPVAADQVARMNIDKPADLDQAKTMVATRQFAQAIPLLEGIIKKYKRLSWDVDALKLQAQCYIEMNDSKKAGVAMDALYAAGGSLAPAVQMNYWKSLQKAGDTKKLQQDLSRTLGTGPADLVAAAYLIRANSYLQDGDQDAALADFVKIVTIFRSEKAVQPEALYRAALIMDKNKDPRAAEYRKILAQDYKTSEYATK